jgi:hypothetical protein
MSKELSAFQSGKVILGLIEDLKNLPNKKMVYMNSDYSNNKLMKKIADRAGIDWTDWREKGIVNIADDVDITLERRIEDAFHRLNGIKKERRSSHRFGFEEIDEKLKEACLEFEKKNIPSSGHAVPELEKCSEQFNIFNIDHLMMETYVGTQEVLHSRLTFTLSPKLMI